MFYFSGKFSSKNFLVPYQLPFSDLLNCLHLLLFTLKLDAVTNPCRITFAFLKLLARCWFSSAACPSAPFYFLPSGVLSIDCVLSKILHRLLQQDFQFGWVAVVSFPWIDSCYQQSHGSGCYKGCHFQVQGLFSSPVDDAGSSRIIYPRLKLVVKLESL